MKLARNVVFILGVAISMVLSAMANENITQFTSQIPALIARANTIVRENNITNEQQLADFLNKRLENLVAFLSKQPDTLAALKATNKQAIFDLIEKGLNIPLNETIKNDIENNRLSESTKLAIQSNTQKIISNINTFADQFSDIEVKIYLLTEIIIPMLASKISNIELQDKLKSLSTFINNKQSDIKEFATKALAFKDKIIPQLQQIQEGNFANIQQLADRIPQIKTEAQVYIRDIQSFITNNKGLFFELFTLIKNLPPEIANLVKNINPADLIKAIQF